jgi:hypothetical protein
VIGRREPPGARVVVQDRLAERGEIVAELIAS